jgi:hypothetical protein
MTSTSFDTPYVLAAASEALTTTSFRVTYFEENYEQ